MMSLPSIPLSSSSPPSPTSTADSSDAPRTPGETGSGNDLGITPNTSSGNSSGNPKSTRKPSRRANTAERRATHNAVERQRRETLNGRFLDLAALLPNLSQIRRPSKSSIVNSSIAHIHASRRHRILASRELRLLKLESDALRRELNEWRDRAGIPRIEEPQRGDGFGIILSGELEVVVQGIEEEDEEPASYDASPSSAYDYEQRSPSQPFEHYPPPPPPPQQQRPTIQLHHGHAHGHPMIASPTGMAFENPQQGYYSPASAMPVTPQLPPADDKWMFQQQQQQQQSMRRSSGTDYIGMVGGGMGGMGMGSGVTFAPMY